jgi:hypothetical protein
MATLVERSPALTASFDVRTFLEDLERDARGEVVGLSQATGGQARQAALIHTAHLQRLGLIENNT